MRLLLARIVRLSVGWVVLGFGSVVVAGLFTAWVGQQAWAVHKLKRGVGDTWFHAADGQQWFRLDERRRDVPLSRISPHLQHAFIAVEDHRFYRHPGVDPIALSRAVFRNLRGGAQEGGSTITQQLARTLFLTNRKSYGRKVREALLSVFMEQQLSKVQILELYLNRIYLSAGTYGVEAMAQRVFGKPAAELTLAESALLAGLARAPASLSPWWNREGAVARSHVVLTRMREEGFITDAEEQDARGATLRVRPFRSSSSARSGYVQDYLRQQFRNRMGGDHPPDWRVDTTIDASLQRAAEQAVEQGLRRAGRASLQAALVVLDPATGDVVAMVGGRDYAQSPFNRATRARRQPGSAFKPLLYAAALADGFSPVSTLDGLDAPPPEGTGDWTPRNADGATSDVMTLRAALRTSNNRAATALQQRVGGRRVLALASRAGLRDQPLVPSLSLGTGLVTPLDLTAAYALFPNGGFAVRPRGILQIVDDDGSVAFTTPVHRERVVSPQVAFQMVSMLTDVLDRGTGAPARRLGVRFPAGGKTGTTNDGKDVWFVGFSAGLVAGVWVGFDQPETLGPNASGARYALPIWADFMRQASRVRPPVAFERPAGLEEERLCRESFLQPVDGCPTYIELLKQGDATPNRLCPLHRGSAKQRATRTVQGWAAEVGRRIRDIFR
jgi:1A family penicillin-binding protein